MSGGPHDDRRSSLPPPGFTNDSSALKRVQLIELLEKVRDRIQHEPEFVEQQTKETDLLLSIAQLTLLSIPSSPQDKRRDFLNQILTIGQELIKDNSQVKNTHDHVVLLTESSPSSTDTQDPIVSDLPSDTPNDDGDGDFSLDDLANEYLEGDTSPSSATNKVTRSSESNEPDLTLDDLSKTYLSSTPPTSVLTNIVFPPPPSEPTIYKNELESILFSNRLSSHDAADDADQIWKDDSSQLGQLFCTKTADIPIVTTKRISTCLLDRSLYERLTRLIARLPKQCILRYNASQLSFRTNEKQPQRPPRPNNDHRRPQHRPTFQENFSQAQSIPRYPPSQNPRQYNQSSYGGQQGYFVDRRTQQQQSRYSHPSQLSFAPYPDDHQPQQKGPLAKQNLHAGGFQQQRNNPPANNQQRGPKKGSGNGGNKLTNDKSGVPGSGPSLNPK